ncbi:MAG: response regulator [Candidatus Riflebacteria bacterium]|nr:response regulator [Candidatus Riflebacteria bacterium]
MPSKPKVLIVDDEERFRATMCKRLRVRGLQAATAGSGREALEELRRDRYDVVILDLRMPGMGGVDALIEMKQADPSIEVIVLTGYASVETAGEITRLGGYDFLLKPCDVDDLVEKIEAAHDRKLARARLMGESSSSCPREG